MDFPLLVDFERPVQKPAKWYFKAPMACKKHPATGTPLVPPLMMKTALHAFGRITDY
jgi:hypothetical protein